MKKPATKKARNAKQLERSALQDVRGGGIEITDPIIVEIVEPPAYDAFPGQGFQWC